MPKPRLSQVQIERHVQRLAEDLAEYRGYRALWLNPRGDLIHCEPEDECEAMGWTLVAVVMHPDRKLLRLRLLPFVATETRESRTAPVIEPLVGLLPA